MKNNKWILLAEDDANTAELTIGALEAERLGCTLVLARDGAEALDCLHRYDKGEAGSASPPILVLLDMKMPRMDGLETLRRIKADERLRSIPVVMLTSSRHESDLVRSYGLGANAYVVKPVEFREFRRALALVAEFWATVNEPPPDAVPSAAESRTQLAAAV